MSNRKLAKAIQNLVREVQKFHHRFNRAVVNWLLRSAFVSQRRGQPPLAGFVLPTTVLLVLILTLTVGAMTLRAFDRNAQVQASAQEKVLYNAATPAIDRARSKLEYLFEKDTRYNRVAGASENQLLGWLTNAPGTYGSGDTAFTLAALEVRGAPDGGGPDVYTLPDEQRIDVGSANAATFDGTADNAWRYRADTNGDGTDDATVVYSIFLSTPEKIEEGKPPEPDEKLLLTMSDQAKADKRIVRYPPLTRETRLLGCSTEAGSDGTTPAGWFEDPNNPINLLKSFQVNALVIPDNAKAANVTLEFQQDRQIQRGNKWGAWFRYDLEVYPGPQFNWNGAMHTEGSMFFGNASNFEAYLVSAPTSCLYRPDSSELSITDRTPPSASDPNAANLGDFEGQAAAGLIGKPSFRGGGAWIHVPPPAGESTPPQRVQLTVANDSTIEPNAVGNIASDPVAIVLEEKTRSLNPNDPNNRKQGVWEERKEGKKLDEKLAQRFKNESTPVPYVDDLYRADNRWGPKPKYDDQVDGQVPSGAMVGDEIPVGNRLTLTPTTPTEVEKTGIGLDGYWERRARVEGLRLLVGERLELGNLGGWVTPRDVNRNDYINLPAGFNADNPPVAVRDQDTGTPTEREGDPLYPPTVRPFPVSSASVTLPHLTQQRRSLRDNIPAVQAGTVYHAAVGNKDYPVACVAMTAHPGTPNTLRQSSNFFPTSFKENDSNADTYLLSDFFNGRGTNGWEYVPPGGDAATFKAQVENNTSPLRLALENLAHFAGDPDGAYPPLQEANRIHPYPALSMWGNFSNLRRALDRLATVGYDAMSVADKTYLQTAACNLGLLATNIDQLQKFDPTNPNNYGTWNGTTEVMRRLGDRLANLMDGDVSDGEVLPKARLSTYRYDRRRAAFEIDRYNPRDYDEVPPEAFIAGLKQQTIRANGDYWNDPVIRMAELIMTSHQVRRDRTFGFRPSPAFGEYVVTYNGTRQPFPAACDPDLFALGGTVSVNASWGLNPVPAVAPTGTATAGSLLVDGSNNSTLAGRRLALSRLCGAIRIPRGYAPGGAVNTNTPAQRPVVLPKFPSLYYIFPEVAHGLRGEFTSDTNADGIANQTGEFDHRQPGAISTNGGNLTIINAANDTATRNAGLNPFDREPFVIDDYINQTDVSGGTFTFQPITAAASANPRLAAYPTPTPAIVTPPTPATLNSATVSTVPATGFSRFPYAASSPFPTADLPVSAIALAPRRLDAFPAGAPAAVLPNYTPRGNQNDTSPNRIMIPKGANAATEAVVSTGLNNTDQLPTKPWAIPFMDKAMFDGRQLQTARVTDIDWGMLRSTKPANQTSGNTKFSPDEPWLPMSGIVYAFREDAIREDAIARPGNLGPVSTLGVTNNQLIAGTAMDLTDLDAPYDPAVQGRGISVKSIDHLPDPDRRVHGFRMRNGTQLKRNPSILGSIPAVDNVRGLTFVTDQPVYMLGDFNLHQAGNGNETSRGALLEEFTQQLFPDGAGVYGYNQFYTNRTTKEPRFATLNEDRWRPSEILADAISILSNDICDGSIADTFVAPVRSPNSIPDFNASGNNGDISYPNDIDRRVYNEYGLYAPSCTDNENTTFQNQNRVSQNPPTNNNNNVRGWEWKREGAEFVAPTGTSGEDPPWSDFTTPIQIGRTGEPLLVARPGNNGTNARQINYLPVNYRIDGFNRNYNSPANGRQTSPAISTRINAIVVSGLPPSREKQSYGGLHNFPRFLENWGNDRFFFSGSFLQLNFSNYASGPFEQEAWEPGEAPGNSEPIPHYSPPNRLWGYDVALQLAPAGPAASRFVSSANTQSEFYTEPPISDPYINKLCTAAKNAGLTAAKCVSQQP